MHDKVATVLQVELCVCVMCVCLCVCVSEREREKVYERYYESLWVLSCGQGLCELKRDREREKNI